MSNLQLSVIHDANSYPERKKIARHHLGDFSLTGHVSALRPIVNAQATLERVQFKSKFKQADITQACRDVATYDRHALLDDIHAKVAAGCVIYARGRKWFDSVNGNTYHTVTLNVAEHSVYLPMQYGYGDQWQETAKQWLVENEIVANPGKYSNGMQRSFTHEITWGPCPYGLKREL